MVLGNFDIAGGGDAWGKGEVGVNGVFEGFGIESWGHGKASSGVSNGIELVNREDGAAADKHLGNLLGKDFDSVEGRIGPECQFHGGDPSGKECFSQWYGLFGIINDDHGENTEIFDFVL